MLSQLGYGLGMFFLLPLGDKLNRKNLILLLCGLLILTLILFAYSSSLTVICTLSFFIGLFSTPAQIILPMAATLGKENRGKNVGKVFSGILVGILGARVLSGLITEWLGWRYVYGISAFMVLTMSTLLWQTCGQGQCLWFSVADSFHDYRKYPFNQDLPLFHTSFNY